VDESGFLMDGMSWEATEGLIWVGDDLEVLEQHLIALAHRLVGDDPPEGWPVGPLLRIDVEALAPDVRDMGAAVLGDAVQRGATLALPRLDLMLDADGGEAFLEALRERMSAGELKQCILLLDRAALGRLRQADPRLVAFFGIRDVETGASSSPTAITVTTDSADLGWTIAVRCELTAPAPALDGLTYGLPTAAPGAGEALEAAGVDRVHGVRHPDGRTTVIINIAPASVPCDAVEEAERRAIAATRRLVGRPLGPDEALTARRMICHAPRGFTFG
jgi:hypothetical protein